MSGRDEVEGAARSARVGTWATAPTTVEAGDVRGRTLRSVAHVSIGGRAPRVRLSNAFGTGDLRIGSASVALRSEGLSAAGDTVRPLTFGGERSTVVAAGGLVVSDPVDLEVPALGDLVLSVFLPDGASGPLTGHDPSHQRGAVSQAGDFTGAGSMPVEREVELFLVAVGVDVVADADGAVVAIGDSLTEGNLSTLDADQRWTDQLARRLHGDPAAPRLGVLNAGIGGGRLLHDGNGDSASRRFDRDVLAQPGATHAIVALGVNDLRNSAGRPEDVVDAAALIAGLRQLARRGHDRGLTMLVATVMPWFHETFRGGHYSDVAEAVRVQVDEWIREQHDFDGVVDFDAALRDDAEPFRMAEAWDSGDHLHPDDAGYRRMGDAVDLALLR